MRDTRVEALVSCMTSRRDLCEQLARVLLEGSWETAALRRRARALLANAPAKDIRRLVAEVRRAWDEPPPLRSLEDSIYASRSLELLLGDWQTRHQFLFEPAAFSPLPQFAGLALPVLQTQADIADWLSVSWAQLEWFADERRQHARTRNVDLLNYSYRWVRKRVGVARLIEAPKSRLKAIQRKILHEILDHVPAHEAAFGFVAGRSAVEGASKHCSEAIVVGLDLNNFFISIPARRIHGLFRSLGYPWRAARVLTSICTTATPDHIFDLYPAGRIEWRAKQQFRTRHLAQGAPTSPALANLSAWRLDLRLSGLARQFGCTYTRYADDLTFSGADGFARQVDRFLLLAEKIIIDEEFHLNRSKTRLQRRDVQQRVTGIVVNDHVNFARKESDRLKATLTNCLRHGLASQNRANHPAFLKHLDGRIAWVESLNRQRGSKLRRLFDAIDPGSERV
jgi:hypothetical protein